MYSRSGFIGAADADILVSLKKGHRPTADYVRKLRRAAAAASFPGVTFYFLPADIVTQILNFGLPGADRRADRGQRPGGQPRRWPNKILTELRRVPGLADLRIQQDFDYPKLPRRRGPDQGAGSAASPRATSPTAC